MAGVNIHADAPAWSFPGRYPTKYGTDIPGPGAYSPDVSPRKERAPAYSLGAATFRKSGANDTRPGPGAYTVNSSRALSARSTTPKPPAYSFGQRLGGPKGMRSPGPGDYKDRPATALARYRAAPAYSLGSRRGGPEEGNVQGPGPGEYAPPTKPTYVGTKFGRASLDSAGPKQLGPGPSAYEVNQSWKAIHPTPRYSLGARRAPIKATLAMGPGPGEYGPLRDVSAVKKRAPAYTMMGRSSKGGGMEVGDAPGPGAYGPDANKVKPHAPSYSLPARTFMPEGGSIAPGPGAYQARPDGPTKQRAPAYSMGLRTPALGDHAPSPYAPGPGAYAPRAKKGAPAYSMTFRHSHDDSGVTRTPGPGEYQPMTALRQSLKSAPAYTLRSRTPLGIAHNATPGPGQYKVDLRPKTPSYSIAQKLKDFSLREASGIPGPGLYKPRWLRDGSWRNMGVKASVNLKGADL